MRVLMSRFDNSLANPRAVACDPARRMPCAGASAPQSVRAGLDLLSELPALHRRIAFLGSMLELGDQEDVLHSEVLQEALRKPLDVIVATGLFARVAPALAGGTEGRLLVVEDPMDAFANLRPHLRGDEILLLKGSRGVALERLIPLLEEAFGESEADGGGN